MKKLLLPILLFSLLTGCSKDDEQKHIFSGGQKDLTGEWHVHKCFLNDVEYNLMSCEYMDFITIDSEGKAVWNNVLIEEFPCNVRVNNLQIDALNYNLNIEHVSGDLTLQYLSSKFIDENKIEIVYKIPLLSEYTLKRTYTKE